MAHCQCAHPHSSKEQVCLSTEMTLAICSSGREWDLWSQCRKKRVKFNTIQWKRSWDSKMGEKSRRVICQHLGGVHIQCVASFLTEKVSTWSVHESKQMWSIWIWCFNLHLFFICSLQCSWNYWAESDRLEFGLASGAFELFSSYLSNLHSLLSLPRHPACKACTKV